MTTWRRLRYPLAAAFALVFLAAMVVSGAMPQQRQFVRFEAKGVLTLPPERILRVELSRDGKRVTLLRRGETAWTKADGTDLGPAGTRVSMAVQVMHNSAPVREIGPAELAGTDSGTFGLDPPRLTATLYGPGKEKVLTAHFGDLNPEEYLQYMRIDGDARLFLMSRFVGSGWSDAMAAATSAGR
ncbi:MAG: hypothetical protein IRY87_08720 [Acetobacteraceae bacterium]|nr:hypothetical protein [Acetobacteraceae bacterium]